MSYGIDSQSWLLFSNSYAWIPYPKIMSDLVWGVAPVILKYSQMRTTVVEGENNIARGK